MKQQLSGEAGAEGDATPTGAGHQVGRAHYIQTFYLSSPTGTTVLTLKFKFQP